MRLWILAGLFALAACKHDDGMPTGTATIHSGTPGGPKVTNLDDPGQSLALPASARGRMGDELARAFCKHDRECALGDTEPRWRQEETCFSDARGGARASLEQWPCDPLKARVGFDRCLLAIREADCSARGGEGAQIPACLSAEICRRSNVAP